MSKCYRFSHLDNLHNIISTEAQFHGYSPLSWRLFMYRNSWLTSSALHGSAICLFHLSFPWSSYLSFPSCFIFRTFWGSPFLTHPTSALSIFSLMLHIYSSSRTSWILILSASVYPSSPLSNSSRKTAVLVAEVQTTTVQQNCRRHYFIQFNFIVWLDFVLKCSINDTTHNLFIFLHFIIRIPLFTIPYKFTQVVKRFTLQKLK